MRAGLLGVVHATMYATAMSVVLAMAGCSYSTASRPRLADHVERPQRNVVVFIGDGMDVQRLHELLDAGMLPNIHRTFVAGGVEVRDAVSSMPSVTYPNSSAIITGLYPGHHEIMGNFWFDRSRAVTRNYMTLATARDVNGDLMAPTIYDALADRFTVSILPQTHKGVVESIDLRGFFDWGWILGYYLAVDHEAGKAFPDVIDLANRVGRLPSLVVTYYPAIDELGHRYGPDSEEFLAAMVDLDQTVGRVTATIEELGLSSSTYYALIADHGMVPARVSPSEKRVQCCDFIGWLKKDRGLKLLDRSLDDASYADRLEKLRTYDAVASVDAGRVAMIHLRSKGDWLHRPSPDEVRAWAMQTPAIHEQPAVEMVASRGGTGQAGVDQVKVWSRHGSLTVERRVNDGRKQYRITDYVGGEGLHSCLFFGAYGDDGTWHDSREWLVASASSRYPDFVAQVVEMFDSPRTGDLVVFAADGWLLYPNEAAGHGSVLHRDMFVPMFFAGPDLPAGGQIAFGRLVDFTPTLLGLLGESGRIKTFPTLDGIDLSSFLRHPAPPSP